jgi:hypothetical protein
VAISREKLAKLFKKSCLKRLKGMGRDYRIGLAQRARLLQRIMKGYLANKRTKARLKDECKYNAAVMIQKYCRGLCGYQKIETIRIEIGASIMIQAWWKGVRLRKQFHQYRRMVQDRPKRQLAHQ